MGGGPGGVEPGSMAALELGKMDLLMAGNELLLRLATLLIAVNVVFITFVRKRRPGRTLGPCAPA